MDPLRIALLASHHATGVERLLSDPFRGITWDLSLVVGSERTLHEAPAIEAAGVPLELRPMRKLTSFRNLHAREEYDHEIGELLQSAKPDYVLVSGYEYILTGEVLQRFPSRVIAIHDADLSIRDRALYTGPHAVRYAILAGEPETRSSVYIVTREVGRGPLLLLSAPYPVAHMAQDARERGNADFLTEYAALHRRWMVTTSWGDMLARTLELLAGGTMKILGDIVWFDGAPGPCRMGESPRVCHDPETMLARGIPRSCPFIG
jgi:folate-dependent phosphoribosylglycinamide formyltransferase PurN